MNVYFQAILNINCLQYGPYISFTLFTTKTGLTVDLTRENAQLRDREKKRERARESEREMSCDRERKHEIQRKRAILRERGESEEDTKLQ